jgi:HD-like signal output (HDOD) protein/CRP-like cAMP-binding protein
MTVKKKTENDPDQQIQFLRRIPFFQDFDNHEIKQFLAVSKWLRVPANTLIIKEGDAEMIFYILVKGQVSIFKTLADGKVLELTTLLTGACFGEMALVSETKRTAGVEASTDSYLLMVDPKIVSTSSVFLQLKFYKRFCEIMVSRLDLANKRMAGQGGRAKPAKTAAAVIASLPPKNPPTLTLVPFSPEPAPVSPALLSPESVQALRQAKQPISLPPVPEIKGRIAPANLKPRLQNDKCLAINPAVTWQLDALSRGEEDHTRQLANLIAIDPVLSAKVLQMANSPFYRRTCPVFSVQHAIVIIGAQQVHNAVKRVVQAGQEVRPFGGLAPLVRQFWQHCIVVGRIAELLKEVIRLEIAADIYLAGLFHDLGVLALDMREPRFYSQLLRPGAEFAAKLEINEAEYIGTSHSMAGKWLGEYLGLQPVYLEVIRLHHRPEKASGEFALPVALVHLADLFAAERGFCLGGHKYGGNLLESFAWVLIRDQHTPFLEVNLVDFLVSFNNELDKSWKEIVAGTNH